MYDGVLDLSKQSALQVFRQTRKKHGILTDDGSLPISIGYCL